MPKTTKETIQRFNARMLQKYPHILDIESSILFCKLCRCNINGIKIFNVHQHFRTLKHQTALENGPLNMSSSTTTYEMGDYLTSPSTTPGAAFNPPPSSTQMVLDGFSLDLCTTFLEANIPLEKIDQPAIQIFLQKYTHQNIPNENHLRSDYVPALYEKYIRKLQHKAANKQIWISISETTDSEQHLILNFVFGLMDQEEKGKCYLLNMSRLERATASAFAAFINNSLQLLWPVAILYENVQLVVTESIPYMKTALQSLKILYPNMIYVNCLLQTYHHFEEYLTFFYEKVDLFLQLCEMIFLQSPHRLHLMRSKYHYLQIPSSCKTSPGCWLKAALYYCHNFTEISSTIDMLLMQDDNSACLLQAKQLIENSSQLEMELNYIKQHFEILSQSITKLQTRDLSLNDSLATIDHIRSALENTQRLEFIEKFEKIISENLGLQELIEMNVKNNLFIEQKPLSTQTKEENLWTYKFAPIVAADVANLSYAKCLLENDKKFTLRNLKKEKQEFGC
ncbi:uncharacterized protein ACRADG_012636 [Cochliomyia hominivorax]